MVLSNFGWQAGDRHHTGFCRVSDCFPCRVKQRIVHLMVFLKIQKSLKCNYHLVKVITSNNFERHSWLLFIQKCYVQRRRLNTDWLGFVQQRNEAVIWRIEIRIVTQTVQPVVRGVVRRERVGTAFPHFFHVLLWKELKAVLKWLLFGCVPTPLLLELQPCCSSNAIPKKHRCSFDGWTSTRHQRETFVIKARHNMLQRALSSLLFTTRLKRTFANCPHYVIGSSRKRKMPPKTSFMKA